MNNDEEIEKKDELFNAFHALQYERMSKLEAQENYVTTFVTGLSTITISISLSNYHSLNVITGLFLPIIFVFANIVAVLYINKTRKFIKMHQERAKIAREKFAPELEKINKSVKKHNSNTDNFNRTKLMNILHYLIAFIGIVLLVMYIYQVVCECNK